jgi:hypothetical protein
MGCVAGFSEVAIVFNDFASDNSVGSAVSVAEFPTSPSQPARAIPKTTAPMILCSTSFSDIIRFISLSIVNEIFEK